jgi:hypothetical protein
MLIAARKAGRVWVYWEVSSDITADPGPNLGSWDGAEYVVEVWP